MARPVAAGGLRKSRQEKNAEVQSALLNAAMTVAGERGYEGATVHRIVERAEVGIGTLYHHFSSRTEILNQIHAFAHAQALAYIKIKLDERAPLADDLGDWVDAFIDFILENPGFIQIINDAKVWNPTAYWSVMDAQADELAQRMIDARPDGAEVDYPADLRRFIGHSILASISAIGGVVAHCGATEAYRTQARALIRGLTGDLFARTS